MVRRRSASQIEVPQSIIMTPPAALSSSMPPQRIPPSLQAVFVASQSGETVDVPPADKSASRFFQRGNSIKKRLAGLGKRRKSKRSVVETTTSIVTPPSSPLPKANASKGEQQHNEPVEEEPEPKSPQEVLNELLTARGYSTRTFKSLTCGYHAAPTAIQQASYGNVVIHAVKSNDTELLEKLFDAGLSSTPCNVYGESVAHLVCRTGNAKMLEFLLQHNCCIQTSDDYGRTPLHDACWTSEPCFEVVSLILDKDPYMLFVADGRGASPLSYVPKEHWQDWIEYLQSVKDKYWPKKQEKDNTINDTLPPLSSKPANSVLVPDPEPSLSCEMAYRVASGKLCVDDILNINGEEDNDYLSDDGTSSWGACTCDDDMELLTEADIEHELSKWQQTSRRQATVST